MKVYYKARVIDDVENNQYIVEVKRHWWSKWEHQRTYSVSTHTTNDWCKQKAMEYCAGLVKRTVVYEA
jgi:hypothetical protein